jgi:hypothetical protein
MPRDSTCHSGLSVKGAENTDGNWKSIARRNQLERNVSQTSFSCCLPHLYSIPLQNNLS